MGENSTRQVVVVGGGYGGSAVAQGLDDIADVVLVEPKNMFIHNVAALRALVDPSWLELSYYPYDRLLHRGHVVRDRATLVDAGHVTLASGDRLEADVIVLATGSSYPFPAKSEVTDGVEAKQRVRHAHRELAASNHVLLVGAGAVGIELAGEIKSVWPDKQVTIVDSADDVLGGRFKVQLRNQLRRQLAELGVEVVLGSSLAQLPDAPVGVRSPIVVTTATGTSISADIWFKCFGVAPSSDYLGGSLADARRADGFIEVNSLLQVKGHVNVFALGDVSTASEAKFAAYASKFQSKVVVANVRSLLDGGETQTYQPFPDALIVPIGPFGGAAQIPGQDDPAPAEAVREMKGRDLAVDGYAAQFGYPLEPGLRDAGAVLEADAAS